MDETYYRRYEPLFGAWKIVKLLGEGSYGKVFEIERHEFGQTYKAAMKAISIPQSPSEVEMIREDCADDESVTSYYRGIVEELMNELNIMAELKGESTIVSYEDHRIIQREDGIGWDILIRMELLTPLMRRQKETPLSTKEIVRLGTDICEALELCHGMNIVHRDIKPENIFVSKTGRFKLGDFGIARTVEKTTGGLSKKGTYTYMAPEVYKGEEYGASVDLFSLGIVLYRLLNKNRAPFLPAYPTPITYSDRETALARQLKGEPLPAIDGVPQGLMDVIRKASAYNPKERYATPTEMKKALEEVRLDETIPAQTYTVSDEVEEKTSSIFDAAVEKTTGTFDEELPDAEIEEDTVGNFDGHGAANDFEEEKTSSIFGASDADSARQTEKGYTEKRNRKHSEKRRGVLLAILIVGLVAVLGFAVISSLLQIGHGSSNVQTIDPGDVQTIDSGTCGETVNWSLSQNGTLTIGGSGKMDGYYRAKRTTAPWGKYWQAIEAIVIKDGVTSIEEYAFYNCSSLTSVTIPNSVTSIGYEAFASCTSLTSVTLPDSVTSIGDRAFYECSSLTSVTIPNSVTTIGVCAFWDCTSLTTVTIPDSVTSIESGAFYGCSILTSIEIPDSVTSIESGAFVDCSGLTDVYYGGTEVQWHNIKLDFGNDMLTNATIHYNSSALATSDQLEDDTASEFTTPVTKTFADYGLTGAYIGLYAMPEKENWTVGDLSMPTTTFASKDKIVFAVEGLGTLDTSTGKTVKVTTVIRNENGLVVDTVTSEKAWDNMWQNNLYVDSFPRVPSESGKYTIELYINAQPLFSHSFAVQ